MKRRVSHMRERLRIAARVIIFLLICIMVVMLSECRHGSAAAAPAELQNVRYYIDISGEVGLPVVRAALTKAIKKKAQKKQTDIELLAEVIFHENWYTDSEHLAAYYTGAVVMNRVKSKNYPNTIRGVLYQENPKQYSTTDEFFTEKLPQECYEMAKNIIENGTPDVPENVVYQAMFIQGSGVWNKIAADYNPKEVDYFCFE